MRFRRPLLVLDLGAAPQGVAAVARRIAPRAERVVGVVRKPAAPFASFSPAPASDGDVGGGEATLAHLRDALRGAAPEVDVRLALELDADALAAAARGCDADVIVAGSSSLRGATAIAEVRRRTGVTLVWAPGTVASAHPLSPVAHVLCPVVGGASGLLALGPFLRDRCGPEQHVTALLLGPPLEVDARALLELTGVEARVDVVPAAQLSPAVVGGWAREHAVDLVVVARLLPVAVLELVAPFAVPVLVLPPSRGAAPGHRAALDVPDLVDDGGPTLRMRLAQTGALRRPAPIPEERVVFVGGGRAIATALSRAGEVELPASAVRGATLGVGRATSMDADPLAAVERQVTVLRPGSGALILVDAALQPAELRAVRQAIGREPAPRAVAVRLRPLESVRSIQRRFRAAGLGSPPAIDASGVLDEGDPEDVPEEADAVRLARVAARMRGAGFAVDAIVYRGPRAPAARGFAALRPEELAAHGAPAAGGRTAGGMSSLAARLDATTGSTAEAGHRVEVELDNGRARRLLLDAIQGARVRVHVQAYIVADDDVTYELEAALGAAAARGVEVRVLVDSLYSLHESFGVRNALLDRLAARGVRVRASSPIAGFPSLEELKQRDHRKLVVADGALALVGGRNLAREYYLGFEEATVTPRSPWREVPWLDAGARVEGPAVAAIERSFLEAWTAAGGDAFDVVEPPPSGGARARVVVHRGLRDAYTLEAYLALVETARSHLYVVNTFPLQLEVQRALLRAVRRGVAVRVLCGNILPVHGAAPQPFGGFGSSLRGLATQLVHARLDALVAAGAEAYQFSLRGVRGWDPAVGEVRPHVHAKVVSADGLVCAVGSANLDITAGYWESELVLVVEDAAVTRALEAHLDGLLAGSARVNRDDPAWQRLAGRRAWLSRYWPALIG